MLRAPRSVIVLVGLAFAMVSGCQCSQTQSGRECEAIARNQPDHPGACGEGLAACGDDYRCSPTAGGPSCCLLERACEDEGDCCPGQACHEGERLCVDRFVPCSDDGDCDVAGGQRCEPWGTDGTGRCRLTACVEGACPEGSSCFAGECIAELPCGGACPSGEACIASTGICQQAQCPSSCAPGYIAAFTNGRNLWNGCTIEQAACDCVELPPLQSADTARYASAASAEGKTWVASYDGAYGDLVVRSGTLGQPLELEHVDGVPPSGIVRYGPSGPRGGILEPGDDVGRYTDVAVSGGRVYVGYRDDTHGDLKLAVRAPTGGWTVTRVDGTDSDTGLFGSIAVDASGRPGLAYFQHGGTGAFDPASCPGGAPAAPVERVTALRFARASSATPSSPSDFTIVTLACQARPAGACDGCSGVCADTGSGPGCYPATTGCTGCDDFSEACVLDGAPTCAARAAPVEQVELPEGVGLFPSLAFRGDEAVISYTSRTAGKGSLYGVTVSASNVRGAPVLLDGLSNTVWTELAIEPSSGDLAIAYADLASRSLRFWTSPSLAAGVSSTVIDSGQVAPGDLRSVGADASLSLTSTGSWTVAYQDSTRADLKRARRNANGSWTIASAASDGAVGFYPQLVGDSGAVQHTRVETVMIDGEPRLSSRLELAGP